MKPRFLPLLLLMLGAQLALAAEPKTETQALESFVKAYHLIQTQALDAKNPQEITQAAIRGMLEDIDPFSTLMTEAELEQMEKQSGGKFLGFGVYLKFQEGQLILTRVMEQSPAEKAGLKRGDILLSINGQKPINHPQGDYFKGLEKKPGAKADLTLLRQNQTLQLTLAMDWVPFPAIRYHQPEPGIVVVSLEEFQKDSAEHLHRILQETKPRVLLLDLRDNPGGLLISAVETAELFLPQGKIVDLRDRQGVIQQEFYSKGFRQAPPVKIGILMNRSSASAAEILAGTLKDHGRATLIGERSYGKARVQKLFPLGQGLFAKMTIAYYYTPRGQHFDQIGVEPDLAVSEALEGDLYGIGDQLFQAALSWARTH